VLNLLFPPYGQRALETFSSVYPGYHATASFGQVLIAACYGTLDGGAAGCLVALVYNFFAPNVQAKN
jgi:hypothetical protein